MSDESNVYKYFDRNKDLAEIAVKHMAELNKKTNEVIYKRRKELEESTKCQNK